MKVKKKICKAGYLLGYWKGKKVALMPKYHPDNNPDDYVSEEIEVEEGFEIPRLIDPSETSLAEIKAICEKNDIPFFWITGLSSHVRENVNLQRTDTLDKAINLFIALHSAGTTTTQYRIIFNRLIEENVLDPRISLEEFAKTSAEVLNRAYNLPSKKTTEARSRMFHILQSFQTFLKHPNEKPSKDHTGKYKHKREDFLTDDEAKIFFPVLKKINPTFELIGRLMRYLNREMYEEREKHEKRKEPPIISLESVLRLKKEDLDQSVGYNVVTFYSHKIQGPTMFGFGIPDELFDRLAILAKNTDTYIFRNKKGSHFDPSQIRKVFAKASKLARLLRIITPIHLR